MCFTIQAQDVDEPPLQNSSAREKIKAAKIGLITQRLALTSEQAEKFWPIYNEFTQKRSDLRRTYRDAEKKINANNPDPKQEEALVDLGLKIKQDELSLEKEYSGKLRNVITAQQLLNLHQAERDFRRIIINMLNNRRLQQRPGNFRDSSGFRNRRK
jgi:Spy/CpxP family protein refolding chaperone